MPDPFKVDPITAAYNQILAPWQSYHAADRDSEAETDAIMPLWQAALDLILACTAEHDRRRPPPEG